MSPAPRGFMGYRVFNGYPYFVYNGFRHRYSSVDLCDYDLIDSYSDTVESSYYGLRCSQAYDQCAWDRDIYNDGERDFRYFCAEKIDRYFL